MRRWELLESKEESDAGASKLIAGRLGFRVGGFRVRVAEVGMSNVLRL
jgi:hypothetical protein